MTSYRYALGAAVAVLAVSWALSGAAFAADAAKPADCKVGIVDVGRVEDEYAEVKSATAQVGAMEASLMNILKMRQKYCLLSAAELDEIEKLAGMEKPSDKDTARGQEITTKGDQLAAELETLRNKKDPTDQEKARLTELTEMSRKSTSDIESRRAQYATDVQNKNKELLDKLTDKMNAAIADLAKQKGLWAVVAKPVVLWGGVDVTNDLIEKLNKDAQK